MFKKFLYTVGIGCVQTFKGKNLYWHLLAIVLTYILVVGGFDWQYFIVTRGDWSTSIGMSAGIVGFLIPVIVPLTIYVSGILRKDAQLKQVAIASLQTVIVALVIIALYKAFTGRIQPEFVSGLVGIDISNGFNFGFWENGIFWGWPSSHTGAAFALSVFLGLVYKHKKWVGILAILYACYIGFGASVAFHWLSDVVAGVIVGSLVGYVMYQNFKKQL